MQQAPVAAVYNHPILQQQLVVGEPDHARLLDAAAARPARRRAACCWMRRRSAGTCRSSELTTEPSTVVHAASKRRMSYGEIASFATVPEKMPEIKPDQLKPVEAVPADRQGRAAPRRGRQVVRPADLRHATCRCRAWSTARSRARRCAAPARPRSTATSSRSMPGIIDAVALDNGVGIIGNTVEAVFAARAQAEGANGATRRARRSTPTSEPARVSRPCPRSRAQGRGRRAPPATPMRRSPARPRCMLSEFTSDYVYHAQMEPHVLHRLGDAGRRRGVDRHAMADHGGGRGRQGRRRRARTRSRCISCRWAAAFGRNVFVEYVIDAVQLSKAAASR